MFKFIFTSLLFISLIIVLLTALTQVGGLAWLLSRPLRRKILGFVALYATLSVASLWAAPLDGRMAVSCVSDSPLQVQSWFYCLSNRTYVRPELASVLEEAAAAVDAAYPGTETLMLDGSLPFLDGFPLLPHLSHMTTVRRPIWRFTTATKNGAICEDAPNHLLGSLPLKRG